MVRMNFRLLALGLGTLAPALSAAPVSGEALYQQRCAYCHDSGNSQVPSREALKKLSVTRIRRSMDFGTMGSAATPLREQASQTLIVAGVDKKQDFVTELFDKYNLLALPIVDEEQRLTGVITADDIISVLRQK